MHEVLDSESFINLSYIKFHIKVIIVLLRNAIGLIKRICDFPRYSNFVKMCEKEIENFRVREEIVDYIHFVFFMNCLKTRTQFSGFVIACFCDNERTALYVAMGSFLPIVMLCGIIWPTEGMHPLLKYINFLLPLTKSTESMRSMLARGWTISEPTIYYGFIATFIWINVFMSLAILLIKFKKD